jgi:hypothetical protein
MSDDQFHLACPGCWAAELTPNEQRPAGIFDHRRHEEPVRRFRLTLEDGSTAHVTAAGFRDEECIVFYDGAGAEVKTVRRRLVHRILDEAYEDRVVQPGQNDVDSA